MVAQMIAALRRGIPCLAIVGGLCGNPIDQETDIPMIAFLEDGKDGPVAGFEALVGIASVESSGISVLAVDTDKSVTVRPILQRACSPALGFVVGF